MKNNLISAIAGWKSAALLALVAMVAAVAFSGVLSTTHTAQAATINLPAADATATAAPGDTVTIVVSNPFARVTITDTAAGVSASFVSGGGQSVACSSETACDVDTDASTDSLTVALKIADDSGEGHILLDIEGIGGTATDVTKVITVSKAGQVGSLAIKHTAPGDATIPAATTGTSNLTVTVKNASTPAGGLEGQSVSVTTTHGTVGCGVGPGTATAGSSQACDALTDSAGVVSVLLTGGGVEGIATVTARLGTRTAEAKVTLFGTAKKLTAEPLQNSIEIGGSTYIVLTVTDGAGNPVADQTVAPVTAKEVVGPATDAMLVTTEKGSTGDNAAADAAGTGYSRDLIRPVAQGGNIPACGDDGRGRTATPVSEAFADDDDGTNAKGQCVVYVTAPKATATAKAATRGVHTLNFQISTTVKASAEIEVAGAPASITTDAPESVDPGSVTEITVSVWDDTDVLVGITDVRTRKVDGGGLIEGAGDNGSEKTSNGQSKFTFLAPLSPGTSEILVTAGVGPGAVNQRVTIVVGEPPAPEPEGPAPTWNKPLVSGPNNVVWNGEDGADPSAGADGGVTAIWAYNAGSGSWSGYFPNAADVPGGNTLASLTNGEAYWVIVE